MTRHEFRHLLDSIDYNLARVREAHAAGRFTEANMYSDQAKRQLDARDLEIDDHAKCCQEALA